MTLQEYLSQAVYGEKNAFYNNFAKKVNISRSYVTLLRLGIRKPGPKLALKIARATKGAVSLFEMRPDIYPADD